MTFLAHPGHGWLQPEYLAVGIGPLIYGCYHWLRSRIKRNPAG